MAPKKKKIDPPPTGRNDVSVRVEAEIGWQARMVARHNRVSVVEYLSEILRPVVTRDYLEMGKEITKGGKPAE